MTHSILVATSKSDLGSCLSSSIQDLGWAVVGPCRSNAQALDCLDAEAVDAAILDILLEDGSAFQLAAALHRAATPLVFFASFDPHRKLIQAEFPNRPGACREAQLVDLLRAFGRAEPV
jgi:DNA-binding response OmpR family regulator